MSLLLRRLLARFLVLPVGEADPSPPPADADPAPAAEDTLDDLIDASADLGTDAPPSSAEPTPAPQRASESERLERELLEERQRRRQLEDRLLAPTAPAAPARDPEYEAEERRLEAARKSGMDANSIGWMQWQIDTNRANRQNTRDAQRALAQANDVSDRAAFNQLQTTNPGLYKRYGEKVETEIARLRQQGVQVPSRNDILKYLAGSDLVAGNLKKTVKPAPAAPAPTVDRGRMPQTRTDVRGRANAASERDKRRERLRDVPL